jgi:hypothetical protein
VVAADRGALDFDNRSNRLAPDPCLVDHLELKAVSAWLQTRVDCELRRTRLDRISECELRNVR